MNSKRSMGKISIPKININLMNKKYDLMLRKMINFLIVNNNKDNKETIISIAI